MDVFEFNSLDQLSVASDWVIKQAGENKIIAFYGEMGAGKTTLIKEICCRLGTESNITSPTFAIVNEYPLTSGNSIFHFDFYRLQKFQELLDIGFEEYLFSGNYCFIEWPELAEPLLPENTVKIKIESMPDSKRILSHIA
jgi:tRNA threonylcarbamoyladenosine biosynthesis protein TsaE